MSIDSFLSEFPTSPPSGSEGTDVTVAEVTNFKNSVKEQFPVFWEKVGNCSSIKPVRLYNTYATAQRLPRKNLTPFACSISVDDIALFRYFLNGDTEQWAVTFAVDESVDMSISGFYTCSRHVELPPNPKDSDLANAIRDLRAKIQEL